MKYYTYILLSLKNGDLYIGSTENLENRIKLHNKGQVKSTKAYRPWKLLESYKFNSRNEAFKFERFLKSHQKKEKIKIRYKLNKQCQWPGARAVRERSAKPFTGVQFSSWPQRGLSWLRQISRSETKPFTGVRILLRTSRYFTKAVKYVNMFSWLT